MRGLIIPVHGDGACWYRAMAKICEKTPMQFIRDMEQSVLTHKRRRNRTDGNFITTINEADEDRVQQKLNHYKYKIKIKDGEAIPTQSIQWWGGSTEMEIWTWHNQRNAIWIHTHEDKITLYEPNRSAITIGQQQTAKTMIEKWNIIKEKLEQQRDTAILLYSGNHYTAILIEDTENNPEKRLRMMTPPKEDPPTQRERPAKVRRRKRKREDNNEASLASTTCKNQDCCGILKSYIYIYTHIYIYN